MISCVKIEKESGRQEGDILRMCRVDVTLGPPESSLNTKDGGQKGKRPRREEAAVFLEKTYELLTRCPPELASWTITGDSFVVKQPAAFAEHVIPTYFKHRNFSSFVRQLNLYGFRKVRAVSAAQDGTEPGVEPEASEDSSLKGWWEFRHERFVRGRRDLLGEIRRRPSSDAKVSTRPLRAANILVNCIEFEDLRAEVGGLREEIRNMQKTNQQLSGLLQTLLQRGSGAEKDGGTSTNRLEFSQTNGCTDSPSAALCQHKSLPSIVLPTPTASGSVMGPQIAHLQLRQGHQPIGTPRDVKTPRTPASGSFHLRPVQSLMVNVSPSIRPSSRLNHAYMATPMYTHQQQEEHNRSRQRWYQTTPQSQPSPTTIRSPLKRPRVDPATSVVDTQTGYGIHSQEDVVVRELSRIATEIRADLLACITARLTDFLRVYRDQTEPIREPDVDTVEAVGSDIRLKLALLQASTSADPMLLDVKTTCMYRVEILKFISRELPRAVQETIDRRLPTPEHLKQRSAKDRSLLALFVQKVQKALECQMHTETAAVTAGRR